MSTLKSAFNSLLSLQARPVRLYRPGTSLTANIKAAPANFFRNLESPSEMIIEGREFVVSKDTISLAGYPLPPKRGDRLDDTELGVQIISEVREMFDLGGAVIGYRMRCS